MHKGDSMAKIITLVRDADSMNVKQGGTHYTEDHWDRPHCERFGELGGFLVNAAGERILRAIPDPPAGNLVTETATNIKAGLTTKFNTQKHENALAAFDNPVPGVKKIFQNFWSMYHFHEGLTNTRYIYTTPDGSGIERPILAEHFDGRQVQYSANAFMNRNTIRSGMVSELMDWELTKSNILDVRQFEPWYAEAENWFIGRRGHRVFAGPNPDGTGPMFRYERPSRREIRNFHLLLDFNYSVVDTFVGKAGRRLTPEARQEYHEREVDTVVRSVLRHYGDIREDGIPTPRGLYRHAA
jgi:hypothetical protein